MLVAEKTIELSWVSVRDRLPFDGHECAVICRNPKSSYLTRAIGCRLHGNWEIQDDSLVNCDVQRVVETSFNSRQYLRPRCCGR